MYEQDNHFESIYPAMNLRELELNIATPQQIVHTPTLREGDCLMSQISKGLAICTRNIIPVLSSAWKIYIYGNSLDLIHTR
jgi:hypothetical protein